MMARRLLDSASRLLLVVLLATFLSPGFAWEAVGSHGASTPAGHAAATDDSDHHHHHGAHHHHDEAAHAEAGHLLSHMPAVLSESAPLVPRLAAGTAYPPRSHTFLCADADPPYEPPRSLLFA